MKRLRSDGCWESQGRLMKRQQKSKIFRPCSAKKFASSSGEELNGKNVINEVEERIEDDVVLRKDESNSSDKLVDLLPGIPLAPSSKNSRPGVVFVLEKASLVPAYVGKKYEILNPDKHADFLRRKNMNPYDYRPDIIHEVLVDIFGSRLNMAGRIQAVYVKTDLGQLIKIEPNIRMPPTLGKFCAMMSQLLQKFSIKASGRGAKLMRLIENPLDQHLPVNSQKIGLSFSSSKAVRLRDYVTSFSNERTPVFVIGAMAHGKIDNDDRDDLISVSALPLSAGVCVRRICFELERQWNIL